jgi:anti-sigma B factor antagonist
MVENVQIVHMPGACIVTLRGDVDEVTAPEAVKVAVAALADGPDDAQMVVIDLSGVRFIGSLGIGGLVAIRNAALARNAVLSLRGTPPRVARVLNLVGLGETFGLSH